MSTGKNILAYTHNEIDYFLLEDYSEYEQDLLNLIKDRKSWEGYSDKEILEVINSCARIACGFYKDKLIGMLAIKEVTDFPGGRWAELGLYNTVLSVRVQSKLFQRIKSVPIAVKLVELAEQCCKDLGADFIMITLHVNNWNALKGPAARGYSYWNEIEYETCNCGVYYLPLHDCVTETMLFNAFGEKLDPHPNWIAALNVLT